MVRVTHVMTLWLMDIIRNGPRKWSGHTFPFCPPTHNENHLSRRVTDGCMAGGTLNVDFIIDEA